MTAERLAIGYLDAPQVSHHPFFYADHLVRGLGSSLAPAAQVPPDLLERLHVFVEGGFLTKPL